MRKIVGLLLLTLATIIPASAYIFVETKETGNSYWTVEADRCRVHIDFSDEHVAGGVFTSVKGDFPIPDCQAFHHYYGYITCAVIVVTWCPNPAVEWRMENAGFPTASHWRLITAARVAPCYDNPCIYKRYEQHGDRIMHRGGTEIFLNRPGHYPNGSTVVWNFQWLWPYVEHNTNGDAFYGWFGMLADDRWFYPTIPPLTASVIIRGEVMRAPGNGTGMAQLNMAPQPGGPSSVQVERKAKGLAFEQPPGDLHSELVDVPVKPGLGGFDYAMQDRFIGTMILEGWLIRMLSSHGTYVTP